MLSTRDSISANEITLHQSCDHAAFRSQPHPTGLLVAMFLLLLTVKSYSQTDLRIMRIDTTNYPTIRVHLRLLCNGNFQSTLNPLNLTIQDEEINRNFTLLCPSETRPISVALALDRSGSVSGTSMLRIKEGARQFISYFKQHATGTDEGAILSFADDVTLDQAMTTSKTALTNAVNSLFALGNTRLWEGAIEAVRQVASAGTNPIKAVVLLTDGFNTAGFSTRDDLITIARSERIPVYTIAVTYEDTSQAVQDLKMVADSTGGNCIVIQEPDDIIDAYNAIASMITDGWNDCIAEYTTACSDGTLRTVVATATACNTSVLKTMTYRAKLDRTLPGFELRIGSASVFESSRARVPVLISSGGAGTNIVDLRFRVVGAPLLTFIQSITAPHFGNNFTIEQTQVRDTLFFHFAGASYLTGTDTLMMLEFDAGSVNRDSVVALRVRDLIRKISACQIPSALSGAVTIRKRPVLAIQCTDTVKIDWDQNAGDYNPSTVIATAVVRNQSGVIATNVRARIILPYGLNFAQGSEEKSLSPLIFMNGQSANVQFILSVVPSDSSRMLPICIETYADSTSVSKCCGVIGIAAAKPKLMATCSAPDGIRWDNTLRTFTPNPFTVTFHITNLSVLTAQNIVAWIHTPPGFDLDPSTPTIQAALPSILKTSQSGIVEWKLRTLERQTSDTLEFCFKASAGGDTTVCCVKIFVTASPINVMMRCDVPQILFYNDDELRFEPDSFLVSTKLVNTSAQMMTHVEARISFSPNFDLAQNEYTIKYPPGLLIQSGDSVRLTWRVRALQPHPTDSDRICVNITAENFPGAQCCNTIVIQRNSTLPVLSCSVDGPDTVRFVQTSYAPNPISMKLHVRNIGTSPAKKVFGAILQGSDVSIDSNDVAYKLLSDSLGVGDVREVTFRLKILPRFKARIDTIRFSVSSQGGTVLCEKYIYIEAVQNPELQASCNATDTLRFDDASNAYIPSPFDLLVQVTNVSEIDAVQIDAEFLSSQGFQLAQGESPSKKLSPEMLRRGESGVVTWKVIALPHQTSSFDSLRVRVTSKGGYSGAVTTCVKVIEVPAIRRAKLSLQCSAPETLRVVQNTYSPEPYPIDVTLDNVGEAAAFDVTGVLINSPKFIIAAPDSSLKFRPVLPVNGRINYRWYIHLLPSYQRDSTSVCLRFTDRAGNIGECCVPLAIPPLANSALQIRCSAPDTVFTDALTGEYKNPITIRADVTNSSTMRIDTVRLAVVLADRANLAAGEMIEKMLVDLQPQATRNTEWKVNLAVDTSALPSIRIFRVLAFTTSGSLLCEKNIVCMPSGQTAIGLKCTAPDTVKYINSTIGLQPSPFTLTLHVKNSGRAILRSIQATLDLPQGASLGQGEILTKQVSQSLAQDESATITWNIVPTLAPMERDVIWKFHVQTATTNQDECITHTIIEGVKQEVQLKIPTGNLVVEGEKISVPVYFTNPAALDVTSCDFILEYNSKLISITGVSQEATLSETWNVFQMNSIDANAMQFSSSGSKTLGREGLLCQFEIQALAGDTMYNSFGITRSALHFRQAAMRAGTIVNTIDGDVTTTGICAQPLQAGGRFTLYQNQPNPISTTEGSPTEIYFSIDTRAAFDHAKLIVIDRYGRIVATLFDAIAGAGQHRVFFYPKNLSSGIYFYQLSVAGASTMKKMILLR